MHKYDGDIVGAGVLDSPFMADFHYFRDVEDAVPYTCFGNLTKYVLSSNAIYLLCCPVFSIICSIYSAAKLEVQLMFVQFTCFIRNSIPYGQIGQIRNKKIISP